MKKDTLYYLNKIHKIVGSWERVSFVTNISIDVIKKYKKGKDGSYHLNMVKSCLDNLNKEQPEISSCAGVNQNLHELEIKRKKAESSNRYFYGSF